MRFLIAHNAYLGQFEYFAPWLAENGHEVTITNRDAVPSETKLKHVQFKDFNKRAKEQTFLLKESENALMSGIGCAIQAAKMRDSGYNPDVIMAHCGW